ncbi:MAG: glycosyltransferase family 9 protein [Victivallales bacterium]|jgi:ADP-heptose:LPS heptosyltransferase|nr:glycosyltransferase family 9 protein [Victivallales bacterium]
MQLRDKIGLFRDFVYYKSRAFFRRPRVEKAHKERILVVRLDRIGDFALYAPFAKGLRKIYPKERYTLTLLGRSLWLDLARTLDFDSYEELDPDKFLADSNYRSGKLKWVAAQKFDLLLQPRFYREILVEDLIALVADAPRSVAFASTTRHLQPHLMRYSDRIYTELLDSGELLNTHELIRNLVFLKYLAPELSRIENPWKTHSPTPPLLSKASPYVVFLPGSGKGKELIYPPENFGELAQKLEDRGFSIVVCGTADESPLSATLLRACRSPQYDLTGEQNITEFAATLANATMIVGNDTGGIHIGAMSKVPTLAVVGGGQPRIFLPYPDSASELLGITPPIVVNRSCQYSGCNFNCRFSGENSYECIRKIPVAQIEEELFRLYCSLGNQGTLR